MIKSYLNLEYFVNQKKRKHKKTTYLVNDSPRSNPLTSKKKFSKFQIQKK